MGYLNEDGLARYDGLIKNWVTFKSGTVDGIDPLLNWQKTATAASVTFYPLPAAPLDPVVTFAFTETGPAEGTKAPDNPSTITGVSSITVTRCETVGVDSTDYTIDLNGTFYGGSVDLSAGTMTVTWVGHVFDGTENFGNPQTLNYVYRFTTSSPVFPSGSVISIDIDHEQLSTHFIANGSNSENSQPHFYIAPSTGTVVIFSIETSSANLKTWLASQYSAGTPLVMVAKYIVPPTVQLTPTQIYSLSQIDPYTPRLNTIYSDQTGVQVGYPKSPLATSTELTNAIISLGGNI